MSKNRNGSCRHQLRNMPIDRLKLLLRQDVLTTGEVSALFGISPRVVTQLCDRNQLAHYRVPGPGNQRGDRRVYIDSVLQVAREQGMLHILDLYDNRVLCMGRYPVELPEGCVRVESSLDLGHCLTALTLLVVIDAESAGAEWRHIAIRAADSGYETPVIVMMAEDGGRVVEHPLITCLEHGSVPELMRRIRELLG